MNKRKAGAVLLTVLFLLSAGACKKKAPAPPPPPAPVAPKPEPPPPPPPKPTISSFTVEPSTIERGQSATLRWSTSNADTVSIDQGIGTVAASGSRTVSPSTTTTYRLTASGPGGQVSESVTLRVTEPPPPPPPPQAPTLSFAERVARELQDAYFDFDKSDIREDARATLTRNADALKAIFQAFPSGSVTIEGHCDERGSAEYNLGLGDRRATAARDFLVQLGVPENRLKTISYGKERPQCTESNEECWQKNRRAHFVGQ